MSQGRNGSHQFLRNEIESLCKDYSSRLSREVGRVAESSLARTKEAADADATQVLEDVARSARKIRSAGEAATVLSELVDATSLFCRRTALLLHAGGRMVGFRSAGASERRQLHESDQLAFDLGSAPAIAHAVENRLMVQTKGAQHNISQILSRRLAYGDEEEVQVFPLTLRDTVIGVLLANGGRIRTAAIETLILASEAWIEALGSRPQSRAQKVASRA